MPKRSNGFEKNKKRASKAGEKSKRKPYDQEMRAYFEKFIYEKEKRGDKKDRLQLMIDAAYVAFRKGNHRPLAYLKDRMYGKAKNTLELKGLENMPKPILKVDGKIFKGK